MPKAAPTHKPARLKVKRYVPIEKERGNSTQRGYGYRWQQTSKGWLNSHPLCVHCYAKHKLTPATEVDHIIPHRGDMNLFWDRSNWQSLCKPCHSRKTGQGQ